MKDYIISIQKQFEYYKSLANKTIDQLDDDKLFWQYNDESNSIAILMNHIAGNMISRWTDFYTSDGEKEWRNRDSEFIWGNKDKTALIEKWEKGWRCLNNVIENLKEEDLGKTIYIRNMGHTVIEAINRQLAHYPYHIGQIVFIGKMVQDSNWNSLSIPKNQSSNYNAEKFSKEKRNIHFTDDL
jgi:transposase InsO family protein